MDADINFLYIKKPSDVVQKDNQLSAMRTINQEYFSIDKKIKDLIAPISKDYSVHINHTFIIGNLKNEIEQYIDENKPDIIVLGKRKSKMINIIGDNITQFILKKYKGIIVISDETNPLEPNSEVSLGLFNKIESNNVFLESVFNFAFNFLDCSKKRGWVNRFVGTLLSKSKDFAGEIMIFI